LKSPFPGPAPFAIFCKNGGGGGGSRDEASSFVVYTVDPGSGGGTGISLGAEAGFNPGNGGGTGMSSMRILVNTSNNKE
jgi:hypothetical protein